MDGISADEFEHELDEQAKEDERGWVHDPGPDGQTGTDDLIVDPAELAKYLSDVYRDPEVSNFERLNAASALMGFWAGVEMGRLGDIMKSMAKEVEDAFG